MIERNHLLIVLLVILVAIYFTQSKQKFGMLDSNMQRGSMLDNSRPIKYPWQT